MKALPLKLVSGHGYQPCEVQDATHVGLRFEAFSRYLELPIIIGGSRDAHEGLAWSWNGDTEYPTLKPSIKSTFWAGNGSCHDDGGPSRQVVCHTWVNDGKAIYHDDSTHELRGQTRDMLEVDPSYYAP